MQNAKMEKKLVHHWTLLKTTIVATLWNNLSCKVKVMAQFLYILYITVNVVTCAKQKSMYSHVSTLTFDQHTAVEEVLIIQKNFVNFFGPRMFIRT